MTNIYTIGYATKPIDVFIQQLQQYNIDVIADIRSVPYSKVFFDYHKENIMAHLKRHNIRYTYLGDELGPRSKDDAHYDEAGQIQFDRLMKSLLFRQGIDRLKTGIERNFSIALMCAEKDATTCHRSQLVGYYLARHTLSNTNITSEDSGPNILHISHEGELETQEALEERIMTMHDNGSDLFMSYEQRKENAYLIQCKLTSYNKNDH